MATNQVPGPSGQQAAPQAQEFVVRLPRDRTKRHSLMKFHNMNNVNFTKCGSASIERENNFKEFKLSYNQDTMPKFGAGSEYGRDLKEEARRKKYGIYRKKYDPDNQPWLLKLGEGKQARKYKGTKEGGVLENASYFIFTQCPDGAFEAAPVEEWFNFTPQINYKFLSSEEAEEEFSRREKTVNFFSIMVNKRVKNEDIDDVDLEEGEKKKKGKGGKKKGKDFLLTDMDDWAILSDEGDEDNDSEKEQDSDGSGGAKPKKGAKKKKGGGKKTMKTNSDDEAMEESDDLDEGQEVDYMTDTDSSDDEMYGHKGLEKTDKYEEKGVEDEEALKKALDSEEEEEEEKKDENKNLDDDADDKKEKNDDSSSESSGSSDSDSDPEKDPSLSSALFMVKKSSDKGGKKVAKRRGSGESEASNPAAGGDTSRSATPTPSVQDRAKKRKAENDSPVPKKPKTEPQSPGPQAIPTSEGISEESIRRYLMRKPMTSKDLVRKFKNTNLSKDQLVNTIAKTLKKINPQTTKIKDKLHWYIKKPE